MIKKVESPRRQPTARGGDDKQAGPLLSPARKAQRPLIGFSLMPRRLTVGRPLYTRGNPGPNPGGAASEPAGPEAAVTATGPQINHSGASPRDRPATDI